MSTLRELAEKMGYQDNPDIRMAGIRNVEVNNQSVYVSITGKPAIVDDIFKVGLDLITAVNKLSIDDVHTRFNIDSSDSSKAFVWNRYDGAVYFFLEPKNRYTAIKPEKAKIGEFDAREVLHAYIQNLGFQW